MERLWTKHKFSFLTVSFLASLTLFALQFISFYEISESLNRLLWTNPLFMEFLCLWDRKSAPLWKQVKDLFCSVQDFYQPQICLGVLFEYFALYWGIRLWYRRSLRVHSSGFFHCWEKSFTWEELSGLFVVVWTSHLEHDIKPNKGNRLFMTVALFIISLTLILIYFVQQK